MSGSVSFSPISYVTNLGRSAMSAFYSNDETVGVAGCALMGDWWDEVPVDADGDVDGGVDGGEDADIPDSGPDADADAGSFCDHFPSVSNLEAPPDGTTDMALSPAFHWAASVDPDTGDVVTYRLLVDEDNSFATPLTYDNIEVTQHTIPDTLANGQTYYWQIFARDLCDQETPSAVFNFTT
ncbi:MAG: hypothetical protein KJ732_02230, partial [Candidatus Margulisbacteria bacterium]|nr:hypothetical protein [Candidatus Margulisiibacteriota bacterium]